jgi:glycosyltransferase involved in cell wall biosynthesis
MKVLVVGTGGSIVSGISTAADEMVRTLPTFGYETERLTAGSEMRRRANALNLENVAAVLGDARSVFDRARRGHADVVWIHTFGVPALPAMRALVLVVAARLARRRVVVQFHAFGLERSVEAGGRSLRLLIRALFLLSNELVTVHEQAAEALRRLSRHSTVRVLHNWVEVPDKMTPLPPCPPFRVVFVGGVVRRKGAPQLIDAVRLLPDVELVLDLVGGPAEDGQAAFDGLQATAQDLVDSGRVILAGELSPSGVRAALRRGHLFVLPSDAEGMPLAMLEALAEGRPVLVTDAGNMGTVVHETQCGWMLPDREPATIAAALRRIVADAPGLAEASSRAWEAASERYSVRALRTQIDAILATTRSS